MAYFCSRDCQRCGWPEHKLACKDASPAPAMELVDMGEGRGAGLRAVACIEAGAELLREVPLLIVPNKIKHPFGRAVALYDIEAAVRRRILLELMVCAAPIDCYVPVLLATHGSVCQGPAFANGDRSSPSAAILEPEPELQSHLEEFAAVVDATKASMPHWRDGAWVERYPTEQALAVPPQERMPPGMEQADFLRYLAIFAINAWALPHRPDPTVYACCSQSS